MVTNADILNARILIVDDLEANVIMLEELLKGAGYVSITSTQDPHATLPLHRVNHFDLILLDLQMPGMDGFQVMESLKEIEKDCYLSVLAVTAQPEHKLRALQSGAKDFVSKPFDLAEVLIRVHNLLEVRLIHEAARNQGKKLEALSLIDPLTRLANRRLLADRMLMALVHARRNRSAMAVIYLDLDGFKQINDTFGHGVGDEMLKMAAVRLLATVREEDTVARPGGDEFIISLWHVSDIGYAATVASRAIEALAQPYDIEGTTVSITASAGVSTYPDHGADADALLKSADLAMYEAKHAGKNTYRIAERLNPATVTVDKRTEYVEIFSAHIVIWDVVIGRLKEQAESATADAGFEYSKTISALQQKCDQFAGKLQGIAMASDDKWEEMKPAAERIWREVKRLFMTQSRKPDENI